MSRGSTPARSGPGEGRRAVVTGAGGFAGTWLCRHLRRAGWEVIGWVRQPAPDPVLGVIYREQDLADGAATRGALLADAPDAVFHLAAVSHVGDCRADPDRAIAVNVGGTEALLAGLRPGVPFVFASTCHVYGRPEYLPVDEDHPLSPESLYGRTKETGERLVRAAARSGLLTVVARAFHHTGPGQSPRYALADWAAQLAAGRQAVRQGLAPRRIRTGDLSLRRDYTDVRDVVAGYALLADAVQSGRLDSGGIVQLCSGDAPPLSTLLSWLAGGGAPPVEMLRERFRADDVRELRGSPARAEALGWRRTHDLRRTLPELVDAAEAALPGVPEA